MSIRVIFRDLNPAVVAAVAAAAPWWDVAQGDILKAGPADFIVSPANCIGRMDGGIDAAYVRHFGWGLQQQLCYALLEEAEGRIEVGECFAVQTGDPSIPIMLSAPTMDWPPRDVSETQNAYLAFRAALLVACAPSWGAPTTRRLLTPGLCTLTGRMPPERAAVQMVRAWRDVSGESGLLAEGL